MKEQKKTINNQRVENHHQISYKMYLILTSSHHIKYSHMHAISRYKKIESIILINLFSFCLNINFFLLTLIYPIYMYNYIKL